MQCMAKEIKMRRSYQLRRLWVAGTRGGRKREKDKREREKGVPSATMDTIRWSSTRWVISSRVASLWHRTHSTVFSPEIHMIDMQIKNSLGVLLLRQHSPPTGVLELLCKDKLVADLHECPPSNWPIAAAPSSRSVTPASHMAAGAVKWTGLPLTAKGGGVGPTLSLAIPMQLPHAWRALRRDQDNP